MIFVDASAIVAILAAEAGWEDLFDRLMRASPRVTSPIAVYEAVLAISRINSLAIDTAKNKVQTFCDQNAITLLPVTTADGDAALSAFARFGKGSGHAARLNMGDCFAYGMAERLSAGLLFKGDDFAATPLGLSVQT